MNIMRLPTLLLLLCAGRVFGVDLGLLWDPSSSPAVTNYVIYCSTNTLNVTGGTSNLAASATTIINAGTNATVTLQYGFDLSHMTNNAVFFQLKFPN